MPTIMVSEAHRRLPELVSEIAAAKVVYTIRRSGDDGPVAELAAADESTPGVRVRLTDVRARLHELVNSAATAAPVVITKHRNPVAILSRVSQPSPVVEAHPMGHTPVPKNRRHQWEQARRPVPANEVEQRILDLAGDWKRPPHENVKDMMYAIFGRICLLGNHVSYRPGIQCAHIVDWPSTIRKVARDRSELSLAQFIAKHDGEVPESLAEALRTTLAEAFNHIANVAPLCALHHDLYDGRKRHADAAKPTRYQILKRRNEVLMRPEIALNVIRELEASCYGRLTKDEDGKLVIERNFTDGTMVTLLGWASRAWRAGVYGDVPPIVCVGTWEFDLSEHYRMGSYGRPVDETPKWWWDGWR